MFKINQSPVLTSNNYGINYFNIDEGVVDIKTKVFDKYSIYNDNNITISQLLNIPKNNMGSVIDNQSRTQSNFNKELTINKSNPEPIILEFGVDTLVDNYIINVKEDVKVDIIIKYISKTKSYHNSNIVLNVKRYGQVNFNVLESVELSSTALLSIKTNIEDNGKVVANIFDFGCDNDAQNIVVDCLGYKSSIDINSVYFGSNHNRLGINYLINCIGQQCDANMNVVGVLNDNAFKNFVGTIDFKNGCIKSKGNENEHCILLSNNAVEKSTPILLCTEEDVFGSHSSSVGRVEPQQLFYIMSRGIEYEDAVKLLVKAELNKLTTNVKNDNLKNMIDVLIDERL
ncbi:MAG: SufD family Fe-S cluster assembly protein [Firmicutes bacterium]|nr:SufD family Fe-S cluster assembly protein [Bacillota bacterium]